VLVVPGWVGGQGYPARIALLNSLPHLAIVLLVRSSSCPFKVCCQGVQLVIEKRFLDL